MSGVWGASTSAVVPSVRVQTGVGATGAPEGSNEVSEELSARVDCGARWLDETRPGWWREIDLGTLDLKDSCRCVLGQLWAENSEDYPGYLFAFIHVVPGEDEGEQVAWAIDHGFRSDDLRAAGLTATMQYRALDELWISAVKARFEAGSL